VTPLAPSSSLLLRIGGSHVHQFNSAGSLDAPTEPAATILDFRLPASISAAVDFRAALSPAEASTCGEKAIPRLPLVFPSRPHRSRSPAVRPHGRRAPAAA
jgi:hypothetical protein